MRFGIMAMQMNALVPSGVASQNAMAYLAGFDHVGLVRPLAEAGFQTIELGGDLTLFFPGAYTPATMERLAGLKAELGLTFTVHLPLWSVEPSTPLQPVRRGSVEAVTQVIRATRPLVPEVYVLHATGNLAAEFYRMRLPESARGLLMQLFQAQAAESIRAILAETGLPSRRLAIETIEFPFDLTLALAEQFDLSLCLDTGHVLAGFAGEIELFATLERMLPRLAEIHLHDAPWFGRDGKLGYGKDHSPLGTGDLDVGRLLDRLSAAGFAGPLIFELGVPEALASLEVVRALRPAALA
ncbi:MAG: cobamide remodeling phosphodiesterase CbiR [Chloroflexi bacterium]|nr:cobamide remodeling phosphodiesterase CbiR [Chloroflexota bacterium]